MTLDLLQERSLPTAALPLFTHWHVALTLAGREAQVEEHLKKAALPTFCPRVRCVEERFGRRSDVLRPLVSGYVFVRFNGRDATQWHLVRDAAGVYGIVGGPDPVQISETSLSVWFNAADADGVVPTPEVDRVVYRRGDCVIMVGGPFSGHLAECSWVDGRGARVLATLLGRQTEMFVPHAFLRKATRDQAEDAGLLQPSQRTSKKPVYLGTGT